MIHSLAFVVHVDKYIDESTWAVIADRFKAFREAVLPKLPQHLIEA